MTRSHSALLHTRASVQKEHRDAFDAWQRERHVPEIFQAKTCIHAAHHRVVQEGVPQVWRGSANVATNYSADSIDDLLDLLAGPEVEAAVADGIRWFGKFNELDGAEFTGNIYELVTSNGGESVAAGPIAVERFEVPDRDLNEFDAWFLDYAVRFASLPGVFRARTYRAVREGSSLPYYYSLGNRALVIEADLLVTLVDVEALGLLAESQIWDRRLVYVRREVLDCIFALPG